MGEQQKVHGCRFTLYITEVNKNENILKRKKIASQLYSMMLEHVCDLEE